MDRTPGVGAAIKIFRPLFDQPVRSNSSARKLSDSCEGQEVILVVNDDEQIRTFVPSIFASIGYLVLTASDGNQAKKFARNGNLPFDLLISDIVMPDSNGCDLAKYFRS